MSYGQFGEKYLLVPIVKKDKVILLMEAVRKGNRLYFYEKNDADLLTFFQHALYSNIISHSEVIDGNTAAKAKYVCSTRTIVIGCLNGQTDCEPVSYSNMVCDWQEDSGGGVPPKSFPPLGDPFGGGGGGGGDDGYEYPDPPEEKNPCAKMQAQNSNQAFKDKISELDKKEVFDKTEETGFAAAYGPQTTYESLANTANDNLIFPPGNKYFGYIHTHLDSKDGVIKIFSPADVFTFLTTCVRNSQLNGTITDAYGMVITSQGNYILKYSGDSNYGIGPNIKAQWQTWYNREYSNLIENSGGLNQSDVEKLFTKFLKEKVNINGLEVYKSDKVTGSTTKLEYNGKDNPVKSTPCPN
ncbi:hypothetical protein AOB46_16835 [Chryseobacterium indologenes]|uniref:Uncharacterized protein n=2 Tax=Chryseobacterium indologenes TaxID=253 RepID=A0A0N0IV26_CHRID|nr:hypothetical protein AOB46_16835 [Chryseobacterium indologenes]